MKNDDAHKVIDCQWACPAHTPVPEYIRLVSQGKFNEAYKINRDSNVFPGVLGRVCDRPCEPACRRSRVEDEAVAICRIKRVAADYKDTVFLPQIPKKKNGKKVALIGCGPASLTVANDLMPLGYEVSIFEKSNLTGGAIRFSVPLFRLPETVLNDEISYIIDMGVDLKFNHEIKDICELYDDYDAIFVGTGAPVGRALDLKGSDKASTYIGLNWLKDIAFGHQDKIEENVIVIGGGNTAMDCGRTAKRVGGKNVTVIAPESFDEMLASPWEKEETLEEDIPFRNHLLPTEYKIENGKFVGVVFSELSSCYTNGKWDPQLMGSDPIFIPCERVILAVGQQNAYPFLNEKSGVDLDSNGLPIIDKSTFQSSNPKVFFGGDAAFGPKNIIWAVAHGHDAAISIDRFLNEKDISERPPIRVHWDSQKIGMREWSYSNSYDPHQRNIVPHVEVKSRIQKIDIEVETGFTPEQAIKEAERCLNCDVQTVFKEDACIECDACIDICPYDCLTISADSEDLKTPRLLADQVFFESKKLPQTGMLMFKDENLCTHCGLCAERCPTGAWDMQKSLIETLKAGES